MTVLAPSRTAPSVVPAVVPEGVGVVLRSDVRLVVETVTPDGVVRPARADRDLAVTAQVARGGTASDDDAAAATITVDVQHTGTRPLERSVRVRLVMAAVDEPWWLIPGAFYGENRPAGCARRYPRFVVGGGDPEAFESDHWELRADRAATPAVFAWGAGGGVALVAPQSSPLGLTGLGFAHDAAARTASVHVTFPFREGPVSYDGSEVAAPAEITTHRWRPGERVRLQVDAHLLDADRHGYAPVLREVHARSAAAPVVPWVDVPTAAGLAAHGLLRWHYDPEPGVLLETAGFDRELRGPDGRPVDRQAMHVGWVSGIPWAYALLAHGTRVGDAAAVTAASRVIDTCCALAPSGTFWGVWYRDRAGEPDGGWTQSWSPVPRALHSRTLAEAALFLLRACAVVSSPPERWASAARSNLDAVVRRQRTDGNLGTLHHAETGEVLSWAGAAGLAWVAALAEAGTLDDGGRYLDAAVRAGEYYARFVDAELIHGAPEDVDLAPTSEDGYVAVMAYVALHRRTGEARWLDLARRAADWMLTFRYSYDVEFDPRTPLGAYGFATRGADQASPANQHLHAYGLVCTSELVELSRGLGDAWYAERALETLRCFRQLVARFDGDFGAHRGMVTERYYQTACFAPKGTLLTLAHAWSAGALLLGCEQAITLGVA